MRFVIESHEPLTQNVYHMRLSGDTRAIMRQFVQVQLPGFYLRRPISVCDWRPGEKGTLDLIYKVVGLGTEAMSHYAAGTELDAILAELSDSETPLDRSLVLYARAAELIAFCNETLQKAQITIDEIDAKNAGKQE